MEGNGVRGTETAVQAEVLVKVGDVISAINGAKIVDEIICALHSLAVLIFPLDTSLFLGGIDHPFRDQIIQAKVPTEAERDTWWHVFYHGAAFPTLSRTLLYNVASNWLDCFPLSSRTYLYDPFFLNGPLSETIQVLVPCLAQNVTKEFDVNSICSNAERLLVLCLLDNEGMRNLAFEFGDTYTSGKFVSGAFSRDRIASISRATQLIASIPDKARPRAPVLLSSHLFFKQITAQLLDGVQSRAVELFDGKDALDGPMLFAGETFSRICRRGFSDILIVQMVPRILQHVRCCLSSDDFTGSEYIVSRSESLFWLSLMAAVRDPYTIERISEGLLWQLAVENVNDTEAYWMLWMLFHQIIHQKVIRAIFVEKFLLWKVFPICCLRWILHFSVLERPPSSPASLVDCQNRASLIETATRLVGLWSKREFVQTAALEQQTYITAAVGFTVEKLSREELEKTKDVLHSILQGVSCRLESPTQLVRKMGNCVALVFSRVIDPMNPLYLDDTCEEDPVDWEFGLTTLHRKISDPTLDEAKGSTSVEEKEIHDTKEKVKQNAVRVNIDKEISEFRLVDPNEIIDPVTLNNEHSDEEDDDESDSDTSSDSSLQPYDLSDDYSDLKKRFSQISDIVAALRKSDDQDGVENALDDAEKLIRTSPGELRHICEDLAKALTHIRCSDVTIEGEEDLAETKRRNALIALVVMCPFESLDALNKLIYSPHVDVSQRILILDVMTQAAEELANVKVLKSQYQPVELITPLLASQSWFIPSVKGPAGAGPWKEVSETGTILSFTHRYERNLPSKSGQFKPGKSRRWSLRSPKVEGNQVVSSENKFSLYGAAFMLPAMQGFDKKRHGVDLLGQDFIVLGKLIYMLGVCMKCMAMHPEASALAPALLDMISYREVSHHAEAYVRKSVLFAASCTLIALHPSYVASSLLEGNQDISRGLEWIRTWAIQVTESDSDSECSMMAMKCLQLHAEMALQVSRAFESGESLRAKGVKASDVSRGPIIIPYPDTHF
ncbi:hypothetical protein H6P81_010083 [Aristolochia fimbriata]|uniref:Telomere length regulation protein TEL2 homolog n=1 Tax=Aristolochia fimbriata TaxID=158543 RepID=A0AAV7EN13_ARIFI|nr:hypothetical protein H6P81_010083 [Aristolochia fimbriata]